MPMTDRELLEKWISIAEGPIRGRCENLKEFDGLIATHRARLAALKAEKMPLKERKPMAILSPPLPDRIEKVFAPYAREVGNLVASWNQLHERLGELFSVIVRKDQPGIALAIWYSTRSDLAQRQMLRASAMLRPQAC
jgi:hypothetical protein